MAKKSAGLLMYRRIEGILEVLLVHPGGPFWARKDEGAWSIPKGEFDDGEDPLTAAKREFKEEIGIKPIGEPIRLTPLRQTGGKFVHAWAMEGNLNPATVTSNTVSLEWPPRSGTQQEFPEVDRAAWLSIQVAKSKILKGQVPFLEQLERKLAQG